jgi:hypothetical protein
MSNMKPGVILLALLLAAMAMVPCVSAGDDEKYDRAQIEAMQKKWQDEHRIPVVHTTTATYKDGIWEIVDVYASKEYKDRFGVDNFTTIKKIDLPEDVASRMGYSEGFQKSKSTETSEIFTTADDPPRLYAGYPEWIFEQDIWGNYLQLDEPTDLIWKNSNINTVKNELINNHGWIAIAFPFEDTYYIYDGTWKADQGVATDSLGLNGRDHARLWTMSSGDVIGAAHRDSVWDLLTGGHHAINFEDVEWLIADYYYSDWHWIISHNDYYLNNYVSSPYNDAYATKLTYF